MTWSARVADTRSRMCIVRPTPSPMPPGETGLCPIIVDSVTRVSVMVSMAMSPITGVASFRSANEMSDS